MKKRFFSQIVLAALACLCCTQAYAEPKIVLAAHSDVRSISTPALKTSEKTTTSAIQTTAAPIDQLAENTSKPLHPAPIKTIVLDPGHGGTNEGAIGVAGIHEKFLTLRVALILSDRLKKVYPDANIILTRETDTFLSLNDRIAIANEANADLFISLHFNSSTNPLAIGYESFFAGEFAEAESEKLNDSEEIREKKRNAAPYAQYLAECFNAAMSKQFDVLNRGAKPGDYTVLTRAQLPAVVLEFGFLSNEEEGVSIISPEHHSKLVDAVIDAIARYQKGHS